MFFVGPIDDDVMCREKPLAGNFEHDVLALAGEDIFFHRPRKTFFRVGRGNIGSPTFYR